MPFAFNQVDTQSTGAVDEMPTSYSDFLGASAVQGYNNSIFHSLMSHEELSLEEGDAGNKTITADEANTRYGLPGLRFRDDIKAGVARLMSERHQAQQDRDFFLSQDHHSVIDGITGFGTSMVSGIMNPLDFSLMFMPMVGEEKLAAQASVLGRGAFRQSIARGLVSRELLGQATSYPKLAESIIQGMSYQAMAEIPQRIEARDEQRDPGDPLLHLAEGGLFAAGMHAGLTGAGRLLGLARPETQEAAFRKALDDFIKGNDVDVTLVLKLDPNIIQEQAFNKDLIRQQNLNAQYENLYTRGEKPEVPETPEEPAKQYTSVLDEIRQRNLNTTAKVQEAFPLMKMNREDAAALRRQAFGETDPDTVRQQEQDNAWQVVQDAMAKNDVSGNKTPIRDAENNFDVKQAKVLPDEVVKENTRPQQPDESAISNLESQAQQAQQKYARDSKGRFMSKKEAEATLGEMSDEQQKMIQDELKEEMEKNSALPDTIEDAAGCITKKVV